MHWSSFDNPEAFEEDAPSDFAEGKKVTFFNFIS